MFTPFSIRFRVVEMHATATACNVVLEQESPIASGSKTDGPQLPTPPPPFLTLEVAHDSFRQCHIGMTFDLGSSDLGSIGGKASGFGSSIIGRQVAHG